MPANGRTVRVIKAARVFTVWRKVVSVTALCITNDVSVNFGADASGSLGYCGLVGRLVAGRKRQDDRWGMQGLRQRRDEIVRLLLTHTACEIILAKVHRHSAA